MNSALLIIDVQKGMFQEDQAVHNGDSLLQNLKLLIDFARSNTIPIFFIQHNGPTGSLLEAGAEGWKLHPELKPNNEDIIIQKKRPDSFYNTSLFNELEKRDIKHLIISGIQTEVCVDTTCRSAYSKNYKVTLASDSHSTWVMKR